MYRIVRVRFSSVSFCYVEIDSKIWPPAARPISIQLEIHLVVSCAVQFFKHEKRCLLDFWILTWWLCAVPGPNPRIHAVEWHFSWHFSAPPVLPLWPLWKLVALSGYQQPRSGGEVTAWEVTALLKPCLMSGWFFPGSFFLRFLLAYRFRRTGSQNRFTNTGFKRKLAWPLPTLQVLSILAYHLAFSQVVNCFQTYLGFYWNLKNWKLRQLVSGFSQQYFCFAI